MPSIKIIQSAIAKLPDGPPLVVVLTGGTTGIGSYVANALARTFATKGSNLRVYIIGRNSTRAELVISSCKKTSPDSDWRFIQATDLALISEVDRTSAEVIRQETEDPFHGTRPAHIDLLYMSHCYPILKERSTTNEGLDAFLSTTYYSRIRFITQLTPLITSSSSSSSSPTPHPSRVISIYAGGFEDSTKPTDSPIGLPSPSTYGVTTVRKHTCFMKTFLFESLATQHAGHLSLIHIYPGLVDGPGFYSTDMPIWFRVIWRVLKPLLARVYLTSAEDCGDVMLFLATGEAGLVAKGGGKEGGVRSTQGEVGGGAYAVGQRGDVVGKEVSYERVRKEGMAGEVWGHTMETLERAKSKGVGL